MTTNDLLQSTADITVCTAVYIEYDNIQYPGMTAVGTVINAVILGNTYMYISIEL